jgi:hypothetical protein
MRRAQRDGFVTMFDGCRRHFNQFEARDIPWAKGAEPCGWEEAQRRYRNPEHPWFGARIQQVKLYRALNAVVQGTGARQMKIWMRDLYREGILPRLSLHDAVELFVESPEEAERAAQIGRDAIPLLVPMQTETKFGRNWADAKHKWGEIPEPEPPPTVTISTPVPQPPRPMSAFSGTPRAELLPNLQPFVAFVAERWAIYRRRKAGQPWPWTDDPILGRWSFCNMDRSLDRTTRQLWHSWCVPHAFEDDLWFAMVIARLVNRTETLAALDYPVPWAPERFIEVMRSRPKNGAYSGAYIIPAFKDDHRLRYISQVEKIFNPMWERRDALRPRNGMTLEQFSTNLRTFPNMGKGFLAAQVVADVKPFSPLKNAPDFTTFALKGPGSEPGLNYVLGQPRDMKWRERNWHRRLAELHALITPVYQERSLPIPDFQDLQNQLCEFHKFWDIKTGVRKRLKHEYKPAVEKPAKEPKPKRVGKEKSRAVRMTPKGAPAIPQPAAASGRLPQAADLSAAERAAQLDLFATSQPAQAAPIQSDGIPLAPAAPEPEVAKPEVAVEPEIEPARAPEPKPAGAAGRPRARQIEFTAAASLPVILKALPGQRQHWLRWDRKRK